MTTKDEITLPVVEQLEALLKELNAAMYAVRQHESEQRGVPANKNFDTPIADVISQAGSLIRDAQLMLQYPGLKPMQLTYTAMAWHITVPNLLAGTLCKGDFLHMAQEGGYGLPTCPDCIERYLQANQNADVNEVTWRLKTSYVDKYKKSRY